MTPNPYYITKEITKEQFDYITHSPERAYKLGLLSAGDIYGYGIRTYRTYEKEDKYYLEYSLYDSCD